LLFLLHAAAITLKIAGGDATVTFKCLWHNYGEIAVWCCRTWNVYGV